MHHDSAMGDPEERNKWEGMSQGPQAPWFHTDGVEEPRWVISHPCWRVEHWPELPAIEVLGHHCRSCAWPLIEQCLAGRQRSLTWAGKGTQTAMGEGASLQEAWAPKWEWRWKGAKWRQKWQGMQVPGATGDKTGRWWEKCMKEKSMEESKIEERKRELRKVLTPLEEGALTPGRLPVRQSPPPVSKFPLYGQEIFSFCSWWNKLGHAL